MSLTLRPTALSSPAYRDWADYIVREDSRAVGRIYEDRHTLPGLRWFWSITMYVNPKLGITTSGRAPFLSDWQMPTRLPRAALYLAPAMSLRSRALPVGFIAPCLHTTAPHPPSGEPWLHEIKHDGFRVIARKDDERVKLYSRPGIKPETDQRLPLCVVPPDRTPGLDDPEGLDAHDVSPLNAPLVTPL
jgi:hypothetical protein